MSFFLYFCAVCSVFTIALTYSLDNALHNCEYACRCSLPLSLSHLLSLALEVFRFAL